jgi:hypothetical protein
MLGRSQDSSRCCGGDKILSCWESKPGIRPTAHLYTERAIPGPGKSCKISITNNCSKENPWEQILLQDIMNPVKQLQFYLNCKITFILNIIMQTCYISGTHNNGCEVSAVVLITTKWRHISPECGNLGEQGVIHGHISFNGH